MSTTPLLQSNRSGPVVDLRRASRRTALTSIVALGLILISIQLLLVFTGGNESILAQVRSYIGH